MTTPYTPQEYILQANASLARVKKNKILVAPMPLSIRENMIEAMKRNCSLNYLIKQLILVNFKNIYQCVKSFLRPLTAW